MVQKSVIPSKMYDMDCPSNSAFGKLTKFSNRKKTKTNPLQNQTENMFCGLCMSMVDFLKTMYKVVHLLQPWMSSRIQDNKKIKYF